MRDRKFVLLTGATGQIGRYLTRDLLLQDRPFAVLIRGRGGLSAQQRLQKLIDGWNSSGKYSLPMPECIEGDTAQDGFGLQQRDREWLYDHCDTMLHCAASVDFNGGYSKDTWNNNVTSARNTVEVCGDAKIHHLAFVSTAYVCGVRDGTVYENELECGQEFRNEYEHSKFESERIVRAGFPGCVTMLRPAIVVGDYLTGQSQAFHSFYRAANFTRSFASGADKDALGHWNHDVRLTLHGNEISNLVSVDWVSAAMIGILGNQDCFGKTFHLTPKHPTTYLEIETALQLSFNYSGVRFVGDEPINLHEGSPEERRFYEYMDEYSGYWGSDPSFDRTQTDAATAHLQENRIDVDCLVRLIAYAVQAKFGKTRRRKRVHGV